MTTWDKIVALIIEGFEKAISFIVDCLAWIDRKSRYISLIARRSEIRKELERAYSSLGRLSEEVEHEKDSGGPANLNIQEARKVVADLRKELEVLERLIRAY